MNILPDVFWFIHVAVWPKLNTVAVSSMAETVGDTLSGFLVQYVAGGEDYHKQIETQQRADDAMVATARGGLKNIEDVCASLQTRMLGWVSRCNLISRARRAKASPWWRRKCATSPCGRPRPPKTPPA
jgi:hypothetical protein